MGESITQEDWANRPPPNPRDIGKTDTLLTNSPAFISGSLNPLPKAYRDIGRIDFLLTNSSKIMTASQPTNPEAIVDIGRSGCAALGASGL